MLLLLLLLAGSEPVQATSPLCPGEQGYYFTNDRQRNPRAGGFVGFGASVNESSQIAVTAAVCQSAVVDSSRILGSSVVSGNAIVMNSTLQGNVRISGTAEVKSSTLRGWFSADSGLLEDASETVAVDPAIAIRARAQAAAAAAAAAARAQEIANLRQRLTEYLDLERDHARTLVSAFFNTDIREQISAFDPRALEASRCTAYRQDTGYDFIPANCPPGMTRPQHDAAKSRVWAVTGPRAQRLEEARAMRARIRELGAACEEPRSVLDIVCRAP